MKRLALALFGLALAVPALGQTSAAQTPGSTTAHRVPFASAGNTLELVVAAPAEEALGAVTVALAQAPEWLDAAPEAVSLEGVAAGEEAVAAFRFDVDRSAPVGAPAEVVFEIRNADGAVLATKAVRLEVEAPRAVALHAAYPNPFNPTTTLAFELPAAHRVRLSVYDMLGREIVRLVDGDRVAGRHEARFEARGVASGLYLARLEVEGEDGVRVVKVQRMTLVK